MRKRRAVSKPRIKEHDCETVMINFARMKRHNIISLLPEHLVHVIPKRAAPQRNVLPDCLCSTLNYQVLVAHAGLLVASRKHESEKRGNAGETCKVILFHAHKLHKR